MERLVIRGGRQLKGTVKISGAKNAALPIMAATLLAEGKSILHRVPNLRDIRMMQKILCGIGASAVRDGGSLTVDAETVASTVVGEQLSREMRASVFLMGALLARCGEVTVAYPGGCAIGPRPIDLHLKALEKMGAHITEEHGTVRLTAKKLVGAEVQFDFPSVGATENALLAGVLADGVTVLRNVAREPEVVDLSSFLRAMGAQIDGAGTDTITIYGVEKLSPAEYTVQPDRIEAGTFLLAGCITRGEVVLEDVVPEHLFAVIDKLREAGAEVRCTENAIQVRADRIRSVDIKTLPYPAFPTDLQAPMMALLATAEGTGIITETIFENRFKQVDEFVRMGAHIRVEGRSAVVRGVPVLTGTKVEAGDLRAGAALVLAGLCADGITEVDRAIYIDRGYEEIENKLRQLNADIIRKKG
ncbi:MAG: UDP-N-acetylglucosamine 1-carboxyvinyltransferase [Selenomonadales bacterium]|nr:UDP-N-acetylglucosamine 1-carboxyvinyltransferase [Selenomonadales bacterium]